MQVGFKFVVHDQFKVMFAPADGGALGMLERLAAGAATGAWGTRMGGHVLCTCMQRHRLRTHTMHRHPLVHILCGMWAQHCTHAHQDLEWVQEESAMNSCT